MSSRSGRASQPLSSGSARQNEYFVPRDGIDREVITADICRYLGNDALVRPGVYENRETGSAVQGYYINAYRNLTTAMIEDLKADSARWEQERRQQAARNSAGGTTAFRDSNDLFLRKSNSPTVQYRNSDTHQSRQYYGPTESANYPDSSARDPFDSSPRYPGTGAAGYTGASGASYAASYGGAQGGYPSQNYAGQQSQFAQAVDPGYASSSMAGAGYAQPPDRPYVATNANNAVRYGDSNDPYGTSSRERIPATTVSSSRTAYVTAPAAQQPGYASAGAQYSSSSPYSATPQYAPVQPQDPFYGRASPAGTAAYSAQEQQYPPGSRTLGASIPQESSRQSGGHRHPDSRGHSDSRSHHRSSRR